MFSVQVGRLAGAEHVLMTEMQRRVAELTGIPVHADEAMAKSGGRGKTLQKTMRFLNGNILKPYFFRCFHKRMLWIETIILKYVLSQQLIFRGWTSWLKRQDHGTSFQEAMKFGGYVF